MRSKISLNFNQTLIKGLLLQEKEDSYTVKLSSGYQVVIKKLDCFEVEIKESSNDSNNKEYDLKEKDENLPNIAIFHTGGTIASKVDYSTGAVSWKFTPEELLNLFSDLNNKANLTPFMVGNLSSEDLRFGHYNMLLEQIKEKSKEFDGIIISHGTDTMHYTSAALQYSLENLKIPILLIGAQRSSDRAGSDAFSNLEAGIEFIKYNKQLREKNQPSFNRIGICMHSSINDDGFYVLDSINAKKIHSSRRDAFKQINFLPVCEITKEFEIINRRDELFSISNKEETTFQAYNENLKIGIFTPHPHLFKEEIENLNIYDGVILANTGLGHLGISEFDDISKYNEQNFEALKKIVSQMPVCIGLQSVYGKVNMNVYTPGRKLQEIGVLGNFSTLTYETQFCKLAFLLSKYKKEEITNELWMSNLEGFDTEKLVDLE